VNLYEKQNRKCALSGVEIKLVSNILKNPKNNTASIDRINNNKDYTTNNVRWVHKDLNYMKQDFSDEEFIEYCRKVAEKNPRGR
jgi:hypothetical protein